MPFTLSFMHLTKTYWALIKYQHYFWFQYDTNKGFPGGASGKEPTCQCRRHKICGFDP